MSHPAEGSPLSSQVVQNLHTLFTWHQQTALYVHEHAQTGEEGILFIAHWASGELVSYQNKSISPKQFYTTTPRPHPQQTNDFVMYYILSNAWIQVLDNHST